jgi:hypothetical protein
MKKLVYTLAAVAALTVAADRAAAQQPAPGPVVSTTTGGCSTCGHSGGGKLFGHGHGLTLFGKPLGLFGLFGGGGGYDARAEGRNAVMGGAGQLAFPQHPFVRSPRDFFMMER